MARIASTRTSAAGKHKTVKHSSGLVFLVGKKRAHGNHSDTERTASIRSENLWRLGTLEEGTVFHASHRSKYPGKDAWVWGHATHGPHGEKLSYTEHSQCGWVLRTSLRRPENIHIEYKPPGITYKTWNRRVYRSVKFLWVNTGRFKPNEKQRKHHQPGTLRKNSPVPAHRAHKGEIKGYKNSGGTGKAYVMHGNIGVRYLNTHGWYMAHTGEAHWCFVHHSDLKDVDTKRAKKYNSQQAEARANGMK